MTSLLEFCVTYLTPLLSAPAVEKLKDQNPLEFCTSVKYYGVNEKKLKEMGMEGEWKMYYLEVVRGEEGWKKVREMKKEVLEVIIEIVGVLGRGTKGKRIERYVKEGFYEIVRELGVNFLYFGFE
jgi:hypothetical protein